MATIIDKLLNRDTEAKPSAEELRQIANLAHAESERLAALVDQARRELEQEAGIQASLLEVERRVTTADGSLRAFEERASASQELSEATAELEGRIQTLDQLVTTADARIRQVEARNGKLNEARANIEKLISSGIEAEAKVASFKNFAQDTAVIEGDIQRVKGGLDELDGQFGLIRDDYDRLKDVVSSVRQESTNIDDKARFVTAQLERAEEATRHVEEVVKSLTSSHSLSKQTHEQLRQLNALAQHVNQKLRSLGATKELVDRANAQMNEVNEVVWDVDRKVKKLADQSQWVKEIEGSVERFQELRQQFAQDVEGAEQQKADFAANGEKVRAEITRALSQIQQRLETAALLKEEVEVANKRAMEVYESITKLEEHLGALASKDEQVKEAIELDQFRVLTDALDDKQRQLSESERRIEHYEDRLDKLEGLLGSVNGKIDDVQQRQESVDQVRQQVDSLFDATEKTRNDAMEVLEARQDIVETKKTLELLLREASILGSKYNRLEERRGAIDQAEAKMDHLNTVIEDIEANLENLKEQRTVIEHVAEKLARLDFALQRAEAATRELREERALAARIYKNIQQKGQKAPGKASPESEAAQDSQNGE